MNDLKTKVIDVLGENGDELLGSVLATVVVRIVGHAHAEKAVSTNQLKNKVWVLI